MSRASEKFSRFFDPPVFEFYLTNKNKTPLPSCLKRNCGAYIKFVDLVEVAFVIMKPRHPLPNFRQRMHAPFQARHLASLERCNDIGTDHGCIGSTGYRSSGSAVIEAEERMRVFPQKAANGHSHHADRRSLQLGVRAAGSRCAAAARRLSR
ncbi:MULTISPECIES: hypothetical protein [unclassified Mesorhizobium]|uniref:hypothetical protein n=1 Tax=unclassified Mesorhizobium TaxID=325217 RepID=UPI0024160F35|nr:MULTISPECIES: hypothetical protein [unclassified Mesorhizobium]MDG4903523.1 hypothetical protein [Mesorhizobium sp. WSM4962]MDG4921427.1 hypothetical protein [Mesorhizobium sp. WSM4989]